MQPAGRDTLQIKESMKNAFSSESAFSLEVLESGNSYCITHYTRKSKTWERQLWSVVMSQSILYCNRTSSIKYQQWHRKETVDTRRYLYGCGIGRELNHKYGRWSLQRCLRLREADRTGDRTSKRDRDGKYGFVCTHHNLRKVLGVREGWKSKEHPHQAELRLISKNTTTHMKMTITTRKRESGYNCESTRHTVARKENSKRLMEVTARTAGWEGKMV